MQAWLAEAVTGWVGRVGAGKLHGAGRFALETISGELPEELAALADERGGRLWLPFSAEVAEALSEMKRRPLRRARPALRAAAARRARARAGHAVADRERGGAAAQARRQLGPGDDPRLPRAAGLRGARPLAAGRPLPARAARALPAHVRGRGRRRTRPDVLERLRAEHDARDRRRPPLARPRRAGAGGRGRAGRRAAPVPARRRRLRAEGAAARSWPTSRGSARPCRRSPRSRPTAPTRRSWSARRA